ncbi:MAG: hypothetical protein NTV68_15735 [Methanomicrobiales archaeon]|nr:hypothetical protein [Methanomicrobiales archaeon]
MSMGNLYLDSGESIIQTTDRISVNSVASELLLTNRRIILVDSTHSEVDPLVIPFASIVSLQGGWNNSGEPVITFTLTDPDSGGTQLLDLVFFQQPGEHRKEECAGWAQYLIDHIVLARQETIRVDTLASTREPGLHPTIHRWVAPDLISPHSTITSSRPVPSGEMMIPEQNDALEVIEDDEDSPAPFPHEQEVAEDSPAPLPVQELSDDVNAQERDYVVSPVVADEQADVHAAESPAVPDALIPTTVPEPELPETFPIPLPDTPTNLQVMETPRTQIPVPESEHGSPETFPIPFPVLHTDTPQPDLPITPTSVPESEPDLPETIFPSENSVVVADEPAVHGTPPPSRGSPRKTIPPIIAISIILLVIAGGAGFFALYLAERDAGSHHTIITPTLTQSPTPIPTLHQPIIPANGVWVRVGCNSSFVGWVGNPGSLRMVSGTGDQFYKIQNSDNLVQASFQKQEYTGDVMTVEVYKQGKLITDRAVTAPRGTIDFIIDAKTGNPPSLPTDLKE